jgi:hypothetical protein
MNPNIRAAVAALLTLGGALTLPSLAGQVNGLVGFTAGSPAKAAEVNGNFTAVKTAVDDNQAQITALAARVAALESKLTNLAALNTYLSLQTVNGQPTVRVSGANLQVVNGAGTTESVNGVGNLIVGYDEASGSFTSTGRIYEIGSAKKTGSHNVVVGAAHAYPSYGGLVAGWGNRVDGRFAVAAGGALNAAFSDYSTASGGGMNTSSAVFSSVTGGFLNTASDVYSAVAGGHSNRANGSYSVVSGGEGNSASGSAASVAGGMQNSATTTAASVGGGRNNIADDQFGAISGGTSLFTNATAEWVGGPYRGQ